MRCHTHQQKNFQTKINKITHDAAQPNPTIHKHVHNIIQQIRKHRDQALIQLTKKHDHAQLKPNQLTITPAELQAAQPTDPNLPQAIRAAQKNIRLHAQKSKPKNWTAKNTHNATIGEKFDPIQHIGIYIPGGTAPLISTALMTITLAQVAQCPHITIATPCNKNAQINPNLLYTLRQLNITQILRLGGAQAITALALGTNQTKPVHKIFGPGNQYVIAAKLALHGQIAIDLLPGPSEICIIADHTANPTWIAADLIAQTEHGTGQERALLITTHKPHLHTIPKHTQQQLKNNPNRTHIQKTLNQNAHLIHTKNTQQTIQITNQLAPEHTQLMTNNNKPIAKALNTTGALLIGHHTPTAISDYTAGPSHILPTGGSGHHTSGLTIQQFQHRTSTIQYTKQNLKKALPTLQTLATLEGLHAHTHSAQIRLQ